MTVFSAEAMDDGDATDPMAQFMDVITTFKCKACDFVCHKQDVLMAHVKSVHLSRSVSDFHKSVTMHQLAKLIIYGTAFESLRVRQFVLL